MGGVEKMKKKEKKCEGCGKKIKLFYTGKHEGYSIVGNKYFCGGCM